MRRPQVRRSLVAIGTGLWIPLAGSACGGSPSAPTPPAPVVTMPVEAPVVLMSHLAATPVTPTNGASVDYRSTPVTLVASGPTPPAGALIIDTFEYDDNAGFTSSNTKAVPRQSGSSTVALAILSNELDKDIFWRVRASSGEMRGPQSETFRFRVPGESLRPPVLMEPASGAIIALQPKLRVGKVMHKTTATWSYEFEVAVDSGFGTLAASGRKTEANVSFVDFTPNAALSAGRYFWRARSVDDHGQASDFTAAWAFEVSEPFAAAPVPLSPAPGAGINQPAIFVLGNGPIFTSGTGTRYEVELSTTSAFATIAKAGNEWVSPSGSTTVTVKTELPGGTYYWRARSVTQRDRDRPEIASPWTEPRAVVLAGLVLGTPQVTSPADRATTTLRPALTVANVSRTSPSSTLVYRFEVSTHNMFELPPLVVATVSEGIGSTSWTAPFDLPTGLTLWWRVRATDTVTGTTSAESSTMRFSTVESQTRLYTLRLEVPASCGFRNAAPTIFAQSTDPIGSARFRLVSQDAYAFTPDSLVLDVSRNGAGMVTGTLMGSANGPGPSNLAYIVFDAANSSLPAAVTGTAGGFGMSGTFAGRVRESGYPLPSYTCSSSSFTWAITPRVQ